MFSKIHMKRKHFKIKKRNRKRKYKANLSMSTNKYKNDIGLFVEDMLGIKLTWYQKEMLKVKQIILPKYMIIPRQHRYKLYGGIR